MQTEKFRKFITVSRKILKLSVICLLSAVIFLLLARAISVTAVKSSHQIDYPGIDSMETVKIGGINQCIYIRGKDMNNPVLLFLHGGPGTPEMPLLYKFQYEWEDYFTVVHWDQRGAGKTYFANDAGDVYGTISFEQYIQDAWEVTEYLKQKLGKKKIALLGYSWGSTIGDTLVKRYPDSFSAYIGVGQLINGAEGERIGFENALNEAYRRENRKDIETLEKLKPYPSNPFDITKFTRLRKVQVKYGLAVGVDIKAISGYFFSPYLTLSELTYYLINPFELNKNIVQFAFAEYNIRNYGTEYKTPVIYILGENDYQTPTSLAEDYFEEIQSPAKKIFVLPNAAHQPMIDNPRRFAEILISEVLPIAKEDDPK